MGRVGYWPHSTEGETGPPVPSVRTVEQLDQRYLLVPEKVKDAYLVHLIDPGSRQDVSAEQAGTPGHTEQTRCAEGAPLPICPTQ